MDEVDQRLRQSADACFKSYEAWRKNEKDNVARAALQDAVHELRKIASRIEIELAVSERNEMAQKPIPIPPHRDARGRHQSAPGDAGDDDFNGNNDDDRQPGSSHQQHGRSAASAGQRRSVRNSLGSGQGPRRDAPPAREPGNE